MRIAALSLLLIPIGACASTSSAALHTPASQPAQVTSTGTTTEIRLAADNTPESTVVDAPLDETWKAALATFQALGFKVDQLDPNQHTVGTHAHRVRRTLNGVRLSQIFDCGTDLTGVIADNQQIRMDVEIGVAAAALNASTVSTRVHGIAYAVEGTSTDPMRCGSKGYLERRILDDVKARATKP
ncbi:MAG TPA: hypothetical protein VFQ38_01635 [Longimicrobiales bacterium]|nr:hypothetical protein [Longimicrobiales bacterium]